jgi:WD40 repeat protein
MQVKQESKVGTINNFRKTKLTHCEFNGDNTCFVYTYNNEYCVWDSQNLQVRYTKVFKKNLGEAHVIYKTNIIVLTNSVDVEDGLINKTSLFIWDDYSNKFVAELNFSDEIKNVKLTTNYIVAVLRKSINIYELRNVKLLESFETNENQNGICAITESDAELKIPSIIAFPSKELGSINVYNIQDAKVLTIKAHQSEVGAVALSRDGKLIATTSEKGTLIRVFDTTNGTEKFSFRRGTLKTAINNLEFNKRADLLCATSYRENGIGTVHVYKLDEATQNKYYLKSFGFSGLDYCDIKIDLKLCTDKYLCGFDRDTNNLIIVSYDGMCYRYALKLKSEMVNSSETANNLNRVNSKNDLVNVTVSLSEYNYVLVDTVRIIPRL